MIVVDPLLSHRRRLEFASPIVVDALRSAGVDDLLQSERLARPNLGICRMWGTDDAWRHDPFLGHRGGKAYVIDRETFDEALRQRAIEAGVTILQARLVGLERSSQGFVARVTQGEAATQIRAELLIDATGRPAAAARRLGARRIQREHRLAYPCQVSSLPPERRSWLNIAGTEACWSYQLEGPNGLSEAWEIGERRRGTRGGVDASTTNLAPPIGRDWIAVGDAALAFNPIWSQGLSNAFGTAITVAGALLAEGSISPKIEGIYAMALEYGAPYTKKCIDLNRSLSD